MIAHTLIEIDPPLSRSSAEERRADLRQGQDGARGGRLPRAPRPIRSRRSSGREAPRSAREGKHRASTSTTIRSRSTGRNRLRDRRDRGAAGGAIAERWYALDPKRVAAKLGVDPDKGLTASAAAEALDRDGPNASADREAEARLAPVPRRVPRVHAADPGRGVDRLARDQGVVDGGRAGADHGPERGHRAAPAGQGRERDERAQVDDGGDARACGATGSRR